MFHAGVQLLGQAFGIDANSPSAMGPIQTKLQELSALARLHQAAQEPEPPVLPGRAAVKYAVGFEMGYPLGVWGGTCTCPDGRVYTAGDNVSRLLGWMRARKMSPPHNVTSLHAAGISVTPLHASPSTRREISVTPLHALVGSRAPATSKKASGRFGRCIARRPRPGGWCPAERRTRSRRSRSWLGCGVGHAPVRTGRSTSSAIPTTAVRSRPTCPAILAPRARECRRHRNRLSTILLPHIRVT